MGIAVCVKLEVTLLKWRKWIAFLSVSVLYHSLSFTMQLICQAVPVTSV